VKILVVDDEALARERLERLVARLLPEAQCIEASDGLQALRMVERQAPDLLLLDIRMPGMDGIEVATHLDSLENPPAVIFCTAYDEYALQALQHQAVAYLLKPVREAELARALAGAGRVNRLQLASLRGGEGGVARSHVSSHSHRGLETMPVAEVRSFIAEQKYVVARGQERELLLPDTLKELESEFGDDFLRIHRNALVARRYLLGLERDDAGGWRAVLEGVDERPAISRRHLAEVKQRLLAS
jgi:two-component system response regulator AlgR